MKAKVRTLKKGEGMYPFLYLTVDSTKQTSFSHSQLFKVTFKKPSLFVNLVGYLVRSFFSDKELKTVRTKDKCGRNSPSNLLTEILSKLLELTFKMPIPCKHFPGQQAAALPRDYDGDCLQMKFPDSPIAPFFTYLYTRYMLMECQQCPHKTGKPL